MAAMQMDAMPGVAAADQAIATRAYSKVFWRLMPFLGVCYVASYMDRVNIGFAKLQMSQELHFSETVFGLGSGIFFLGYFLFEVPSNIFMHKVGARAWIARIMISWGLLSGAFIFVRSVPAFYGLRFVLGLAEAGFYPGVILYLTYWFPAHFRGRVIAILMSAIPVSSILGNPLSGWIMDAMNNTLGVAGWKWMFVLEALPALVVGVAVLFYLDNSILAAKWLSDDEKRVLADAIAHDRKTQVGGTHDTLSAFKDRRVWTMCLIYFCFILGQYGLNFWMPSLIKTAGINGNFRIGLFSAIPYIVTLVMMNVLGQSADRHRERRWHLVVPALIGAVGFLVAPTAPNVGIAIAALSLAAAGAITCAPLFWSLPTAFLAGAGAAAGIAVINSVGNLAGFVAPYLIGYAKDTTGSAATGMYIIAGGLVVGAIATLMTPARMVNR
ncbi:MAG: major facilitator superfamily 1 [Phenylobacterium sp.]|nr:major facilitator superfamily 1 [Phenylobacterium sp.]